MATRATNKAVGENPVWKLVAIGIAVAVVGSLITAALVWLVGLNPRLTAIEAELKTLASKTDVAVIQTELRALTAKADKSDERIIALDSRLSKVEGMLSRQVSITVQSGSFTVKNRVKTDPLTFEWQLATPANPARLVSIVAETVSHVAGISITARLIDDGNRCRMVVTGDTAKLAPMLDAGIPAKVTISSREQ